MCVWRRMVGNGIVTKCIYLGFSSPWAWQKPWGGDGILTERCLLILPTGRPLRPGWPNVPQCAWGLVFSIKAQHGRRERTYPRIFLLTRIPVQFQQLWSRYVQLWHGLGNVILERTDRNVAFLHIVCSTHWQGKTSLWFQQLLFTIIGCVGVNIKRKIDLCPK